MYLERYIKDTTQKLIYKSKFIYYIDLINILDNIYLSYNKINKAKNKLIYKKVKQKLGK